MNVNPIRTFKTDIAVMGIYEEDNLFYIYVKNPTDNDWHKYEAGPFRTSELAIKHINDLP